MKNSNSMAVNNPFQNRMAVTDPEEFFGREKQLAELYRLFSHKKPLSASVFGERRIGKSSLRNFLMWPAEALERWPNLQVDPARLLFVSIDLMNFNFKEIPDEELMYQFFTLIFTNLDQAVRRWYQAANQNLPTGLAGLAAKAETSTNASWLLNFAIQPYLEQLAADTQLSVVLLLDEADQLIRLRAGYPLRALITNISSRLAVVLFTRWRIVDLDPEGDLSPISNVVTEIPLGLLTEGEARQMITESAHRAGADLPAFVVDWIYRQGGRHPDFTKVAALYVFRSLPGIQREVDLDRLESELAADLEAACRSLLGSLERYAETVSGSAPVRSVLRSILETGQPAGAEEAEAAEILARRGILVDEGERLRIFSPIFEGYIRRRLEQRTATGGTGPLTGAGGTGTLYAPVTVPETAPGTTPAAPAPASPGVETRLPVIRDDQLHYGGVVMPLTRREAAVMRYLFKQAGQVCPRKEMYKAIWGGELDGEDAESARKNTAAFNIVIQRLREKLEAYSLEERITILSERKLLGYKLIFR